MEPKTALIRAAGHPNIKATHASTLELTEDADLTARGTCIIGVKAAVDWHALSALRGSVAVTLRCGDLIDGFTAQIAPGFTSGQPLIFRRAVGGVTRTLAQGASKGSAELNRDLVAALREPAAELSVEITEIGDALPLGCLFIVGMPIGAIQDLSPRAVEVLGSVDVVFAEDTRKAKETLSWLGLSKPVVSCHDHNERKRAEGVAERLEKGERLALVSDAGMPLVSDPGYHVVQAALEAEAMVTTVPGPTAIASALAVSGLATDAFGFFGFPPRARSKRQPWLAEKLSLPQTLVFYESCHRLFETLADLAELGPDRGCAVCCDLTKQSEWIARGQLGDLVDVLPERAAERGEYVLVVEGHGASNAESDGTEEAAINTDPLIRSLLKDGVATKVIARAIAAATGVSRRDVFQQVIALKEQDEG